MQGLSRRQGILWVLSVAFALLANFAILASSCAAASEDDVVSSKTSARATHKQKAIVSVANVKAGEKLEDFCIDAKGQILALLGPSEKNGFDGLPDLDEDDSDVEGPRALTPNSKKKASAKKKPKFASAVHVYDAAGKLVEKWAVGFLGQSINTAPDGTILIGGDGRIARFDASGTKLYEAESPQMTYINENPEEMRERAKEQLESDRATYADQVEQYEDQLKRLKESQKAQGDKKKPKKGQDPDDEDEDSPLNAANLKQLVDSYKRHLQMLEKQTPEDVLKQVLGRAKRIHAICAGDQDVFVTCSAMTGYGYGVWRTDQKFDQAKEIVKKLSGCCGQMDVQCHNGELYVCENSRHRVIRFNREGEEVAHFGKRDREGDGENFGGCCNPMNLCFSKEGNLYVSESNGVVKHFTPGGKYLGIVGVAAVEPGCKNSCVGVTADDSRLFYIDVQKSRIIVLARDESKGPR